MCPATTFCPGQDETPYCFCCNQPGLRGDFNLKLDSKLILCALEIKCLWWKMGMTCVGSVARFLIVVTVEIKTSESKSVVDLYGVAAKNIMDMVYRVCCCLITHLTIKFMIRCIQSSRFFWSSYFARSCRYRWKRQFKVCDVNMGPQNVVLNQHRPNETLEKSRALDWFQLKEIMTV